LIIETASFPTRYRTSRFRTSRLVAEKHWEAYTVETELLKKILDGEIETSQTALKGDAICRFIIKPNRQEFL
jgi:hypothetical protein